MEGWIDRWNVLVGRRIGCSVGGGGCDGLDWKEGMGLVAMGAMLSWA